MKECNNGLSFHGFGLKRKSVIGTLVHCWGGIENAAGAVENSLAVPPKIKQKITIGSSNSTSRYLPKRSERRGSNRYLYTRVHNCVIHNSQNVETTQVFIEG